MLKKISLQVDVSSFGDVSKVLLAVSGGADSVAMAHVLAELNKQGRLSCEFVIGHVNHCLRGAASDADEAFVRTLAESLSIPVVTQSVDVKGYAKEHKLSIETAGRNLRLKTLVAIAAEHGCDCIATAHHKDDLAETLIHRLMRGTGFRGLCGIRPISHVYGAAFVRPMLSVRRNEILHYCESHGFIWREDASNRNVNFTRNRIRHCLIPVLEAESENLIDPLAKLSQAVYLFSAQAEKQAQDLLDKAMVQDHENRVCLLKEIICHCPPWVFYEMLRKVLVKLNVGLRNYSQYHFETMFSLMNQEQADVSMPGPIQVYAKKGVLGFCTETRPLCLPSQSVTLAIGQTAEFDLWRISCQLFEREDADIEAFFKNKDHYVEWFDADKVSGPLIVRSRTDGDRFWPIGAKGEKKVGRFLQDGQFDAKTREAAFIIEDTEKILWVAPVRMSERAQISPRTRKILEIRLFQMRRPKGVNSHLDNPE